MPTARDDEQDFQDGADPNDLLQFVSDDVAQRVRDGEYELLPGMRADKPVIRRIDNGRLVQGSGRYPKANDIGQVSKETAYLRTNDYRAALQASIPATASPATRYSLELLIDKFMYAIDGQPKPMRCEHPNCNQQHSWVQPIDTTAVFKLIENLVGKAEQVQRVEQNVHVDVTHRTFDIRVYDIDPDSAYERRNALVEAGIIEAEVKVLDDTGPTLRIAESGGSSDSGAEIALGAPLGQSTPSGDVGGDEVSSERVGSGSRSFEW